MVPREDATASARMLREGQPAPLYAFDDRDAYEHTSMFHMTTVQTRLYEETASLTQITPRGFTTVTTYLPFTTKTYFNSDIDGNAW